MKTLCIASCGKRKIWDKKYGDPTAGRTKAKYVYIGPFAKKCGEYAKRFYPSSWCILSAKFGFLFPENVVPCPYNVSFNDKKTNPITTKKLSTQVRKKGLNSYGRIVIIGGKRYGEIAKEVFSSKEILTPLSGLKGSGYMMGKLNDAIKRGIPL